MRKLILFGTIGMCFLLRLSAQQNSSSIVQSGQLSIEIGSGGGNYGSQFKLNHHWLERGKITYLSGIGFSTFWGSEKNDELISKTRGFTTDNHLRIYSGVHLEFLKKMSVMLEGYVGGYHAYTKGTFESRELDINRSYKSSEVLFDYGSRLSIGYRIKEQLSAQFVLNNSWKQSNSGLGRLAGIFAGEPDGKMSFGLGIIKQFN